MSVLLAAAAVLGVLLRQSAVGKAFVEGDLACQGNKALAPARAPASAAFCSSCRTECIWPSSNTRANDGNKCDHGNGNHGDDRTLLISQPTPDVYLHFSPP